ncbi:PREDICTED: uncharacterized protein LOC108554433 [Eufriesea mexicana]|uniref:uncharacterized protein LOC108554433 n=1 Tax=Eufriesea mexicana TaxID=516756 RepID=UPI00083BDEC4|nr:PREDICTED: uncharacterized protein LOC108554433 [Eufriesea mexicana]
MFRFILVAVLLPHIRGEDGVPRTRREIEGNRYCDFEEARRNYNATDLLRCIDELAIDLVDRESGGLTNGKGQWNGSTGRQISFMDIFSSIFDNSPQTGSLPAYSTSDYQQSNYPSGTVALSPGFQLNLLDALSTISRHDDYKCVPRILCEMASGKLPGRSLGKQGSGFFEFLGRNVFTDWLAKFDVAGSSALFNFGRAMILGYSNRGNSMACYEAFPRCPRDTNGLVYYLNNYNGGFFRLFNRLRGGKYRTSGRVPGQRVDNYPKTEVRERIVAGSMKTYVQHAPVSDVVQFPVVKYQEYLKEYPRYDETRINNEIIFPDQREPDAEPTSNSVQNGSPKSEWSVWQQNGVGFFPEVIVGSI